MLCWRAVDGCKDVSASPVRPTLMIATLCLCCVRLEGEATSAQYSYTAAIQFWIGCIHLLFCRRLLPTNCQAVSFRRLLPQVSESLSLLFANLCKIWFANKSHQQNNNRRQLDELKLDGGRVQFSESISSPQVLFCDVTTTGL